MEVEYIYIKWEKSTEIVLGRNQPESNDPDGNGFYDETTGFGVTG